MIKPQPISLVSAQAGNPERTLMERMSGCGAVFMMGQNPDLPVMPDRPTLLDFLHYRFPDIAFMHLLHAVEIAVDIDL